MTLVKIPMTIADDHASVSWLHGAKQHPNPCHEPQIQANSLQHKHIRLRDTRETQHADPIVWTNGVRVIVRIDTALENMDPIHGDRLSET